MISGNYVELKTKEDLRKVVEDFGDAWKNDKIPILQYELAVKPEIERYRHGGGCAPYDAFVKCLLSLPKEIDNPKTTLLDAGASSAYYSEVLKIAGFKYDYTAVDFNPKFRELAAEHFEVRKFDVADVRDLPYMNGTFDIVVSGSVILHNIDYQSVIDETVRVSKRYILFHRIPFSRVHPIRYFRKEAYGIPCLEIHFNLQEFMNDMTGRGLKAMHIETIFWNDKENYGHMSILFEK